jgi:hypothetical protein
VCVWVPYQTHPKTLLDGVDASVYPGVVYLGGKMTETLDLEPIKALLEEGKFTLNEVEFFDVALEHLAALVAEVERLREEVARQAALLEDLWGGIED